MRTLKIVLIIVFFLLQPLRGVMAVFSWCPPSDMHALAAENTPMVFQQDVAHSTSNLCINCTDCVPTKSAVDHALQTDKVCGVSCCQVCGAAITIDAPVPAPSAAVVTLEDYRFAIPLSPSETPFRPPITG